jgi:DNA-binding MarR family transcriptional regulator
MTRAEAERIFRLNLQLSTETLNAAAGEIEALGMEAKEFFVLDAIEERPYPAELARHLAMPKPTVAAYLKSFQKLELVSRAIDETDMRRHRLGLTERGSQVLKLARESLAREYGEKLARLTAEEQAELARLFKKLVG